MYRLVFWGTVAASLLVSSSVSTRGIVTDLSSSCSYPFTPLENSKTEETMFSSHLYYYISEKIFTIKSKDDEELGIELSLSNGLTECQLDFTVRYTQKSPFTTTEVTMIDRYANGSIDKADIIKVSGESFYEPDSWNFREDMRYDTNKLL